MTHDDLTIPVITAQEAGEWDGASIGAGVESRLLMGWAGMALFQELAREARFETAQGVEILAGPGNNGGDGYVLAWHILTATKKRVRIFQAGPPKTDDASYFEALVKSLLQQDGVKQESCRVEFFGIDSFGKGDGDGSEAIVVDALFGVGLNKAPRPEIGEAIGRANVMEGAFRVAVDISSGVFASGDSFDHEAFRAHLTVTFGGAKVGHVVEPGIHYRGRLRVLPIGFIPHEGGWGRRLTRPQKIEILRREKSHKYSNGVVTIIGGSPGMEGAAAMAARAFLGLGGGLAKIYSSSSSMPMALQESPELMIRASQEAGAAALADLKSGRRRQAVVIGVGLAEALGREFWQELLAMGELEALIDGSGLGELSELRQVIAGHKLGNLVLTPHRGEAERLLGKKIGNVREAALEISSLYNASVFLKGPGGVAIVRDVLRGEVVEELYTNSLRSQLATGGSGDVLSGVIANMVFRAGPYKGLEMGLEVYHRAAELAALRGKDFLSPHEVIEKLRGALEEAQGMSGGSE